MFQQNIEKNKQNKLTNAEFAVSEDQQLRTTGPPSPAIVI
jgi:hypothetical protein